MNAKSMRIQGVKQGGFSLIEVLIAVVVLATGLLALTALQGALLRNSADAKARSQVAAYAQSLMEDARQGGYNAIPVGNNVSLATALNPSYTLADVARAMGASTLSEASQVTAVVNGTSTYKVVNLRLNWNDATGAGRNLQLTSVISPLLLAQNNLNELEPPDATGGYRPIVRRPSPVTEGMIPIAMGNGEDTAATNPKPEVIGQHNQTTLVADTRFDLLTFNTSDGLQSGFARFDKRIETAMVGCTCQTGLNGFPTGGNAPEINVLLRAKAFRPSYWNGERYVQPEEAGTPNRSPASNVAQSELCDVCCRDHQDPGAVAGPRFNPWSGSHDHYLDINGAAVTSGAFYEACRVIRVDGLWRVTPDPKVQDLALVPTQVYPTTTGSTIAPADNNAATSPLISNTGKTSYINFAYDFIDQLFYAKQTLDAVALMTMQGNAGLNNPEYVPINSGDQRWLHARAILTDYLESDAQARIDDAIDDCTGSGAQAHAQCVLPYVPLATINATELAEWAGVDSSQTGIVHTGSLVNATKNYGQAKLRTFVSQLATTPAVNPLDNASAILDEQTFALVSGSASGTWLSMPNTTGTVFGDPSNPIRGYARYEAVINSFNVTLGGIAATNNRQIQSPTIAANSVDCDPNSVNNANPYDCGSSGTSVTLGFRGYNRMAEGGNGRVCNKNQKLQVCLTHSFASLTVDGAPVTASYAVVSDVGTPSEISTLGPFSVKGTGDVGYPSSIQVQFNETSTPASFTCPVGGTGDASWTCP